MNLPIWVSAWELECCQPYATVGEPWVASVVRLKPPDPWWAEHAPEPVPDELRKLGVVDLQGTAASVTLHARSAIVDRRKAGHRPRCAELRPGFLERPALARRPRTPRVPGRRWAGAEGVVTRIRGIRLIYQPVTVYFAIPIRQEEPVDLRSTSSRRDPAMADRSFSEFLIDLETNPCSTHPPDKDKEAGPKADLF